jgi:hypothetical protein
LFYGLWLSTIVHTNKKDFILNLASESEEESSNDDKEIITTVIVRKKYKTKPARVQNYLDTVSSYSAKRFQQHFRITIDIYETLLNVIGLQLERKNNRARNTINVETHILSVLWLLATPNSYRWPTLQICNTHTT